MSPSLLTPFFALTFFFLAWLSCHFLQTFDPSLNVSPLPPSLHTSAPLPVYDPASCSCPRASNRSPMGVLFSPMLSSLFSILFFRLRSLSEAWTRTTIVRQRRVKYLFFFKSLILTEHVSKNEVGMPVRAVVRSNASFLL